MFQNMAIITWLRVVMNVVMIEMAVGVSGCKR
jgi:hypothetical protein